MEKSKAFHLKHGRKTSFFDCHRQFLPMNHSFRRNKDSFTKGQVENDAPPPRLSGEETWRRVHKYPKVTDECYPTEKNYQALECATIGQKKVYSGIYLIGIRILFDTTLMLCMWRKCF